MNMEKLKIREMTIYFFKLQNQLQNLFTEEVLIDRVFLSFFPIYFFFVNLTFFFLIWLLRQIHLK